MLLELTAELDGLARRGVCSPPAAAIKFSGGNQPQRLRHERQCRSSSCAVDSTACQPSGLVVLSQHEPSPAGPEHMERRLLEGACRLGGGERALEPISSALISGD